MLLEFIILVMPVSILIIKVMEWTGDYLILTFFLCTAFVKLFLVIVHPILIAPLFSTITELPEWLDPIKTFLYEECEKVNIDITNLKYEESF